jgi:two-component system sensor histidine kinase/response regulator
MKPHEHHVPVLDFISSKIGINSRGFSEAPGNREDSIQDTLDDLQRSKVQLCDYVVSLQSQNRELEAYASTVAHDLKDPIYAMLLTSSLITGAPDLTHIELKNYLRQITAAANQMNTIINNLLLFAKVSNTEALVEQVDMGCAVANVLDRLSYIINEHHAQIDTPESWPAAIGYTPWIEEVWANYLGNAIKHGGRPPHVELGASLQPDGMVSYWMRDNGPGLSSDDRARLFMPFSQIDSACNSGNGLGLSIVFRIVEKLGGRVGVESELGKGSQFFFTLPATSPS